MSPLTRFFITRLLFIPLTLLIVTGTLYATFMVTPPEIRASLYFPKRLQSQFFFQEDLIRAAPQIIERYHLNAPFPIQYGYWVSSLFENRWGYSPTLRENVLDALLRRTPVTAELILYALLMYIPLGLVNGLKAGWKRDSPADYRFRLAAFTATSLPPFILALVLLSIFYVVLPWFPPDRLSIANSLATKAADFHAYTGMYTIDGLLNRRPDISLDALRHLVLPVITLSLIHWATVGRVSRSAAIEEFQKEYMIAGKARGLPSNRLVWRHAFRNVLTPALTTSALSAASLFSGAFIVELIFNLKGLSSMLQFGARMALDAPVVMGFSIYSLSAVLAIMFLLDILQAIFDPRVREGLLK